MGKVERKEVKVFHEWDLCEDCGGRLESKTDISMLSNPQRYYNKCQDCGKETVSLSPSPSVVHEEV
ncbi:hypothetical protein [Sphingobacterium yanglingense]|uniref:Uncharacterized protein n=1 Tax=Sphingobacterium yanglingense TaxID=1437280 RepID=A0A4R6WHD7_9SPHI|nr:hypothetical protein [Sphingobacterium yanglingense]TDQ79593.1 hypothetical protein CLV99_1038 [Sphingobacterium yanglingense]